MAWRRVDRRAVAGSALVLLAACAGSGGAPGGEPAPAGGGYRTFNFAPGTEVELDALDEPGPEEEEAVEDPLSRAALAKAAGRELERRGFRRAGDPDLLVDFRVDEEGTLFVTLLDPHRGRVAWEGTRTDTKVARDPARVAMAEVFGGLRLRPGDPPAPEPGSASVALPVASDELAALAEQGNPNAQYLMGVLLTGGGGAGSDPVEAARWFRAAAEGGHAHACSSLGLMYLNGLGVEQDTAEALHWLELAADQDLVAAEYSLGSIFLHGRGVPADPARAAGWLRRAAEQGYAAAQIDLALLYLQGKGVEEDHAAAFRWYAAAAEQGAARAQTRLGMMYEHGRGVPEDQVSAHVWYSLAVRGGDPRAVERLERLTPRLTAEQLDGSERRVNVWLSTHGPGA